MSSVDILIDEDLNLHVFHTPSKVNIIADPLTVLK
jgi:hypothetical protein